MLHLIYLQRRRILFSGLFSGLAAFIFPLAIDPAFAEIFVSRIVLAIFAMMVALIAMLFLCVVLPIMIHAPLIGSFRIAAELVPLCLFLEISLHLVLGVEYGASNLPFAWLPIWLGLWGLTYGGLLDWLGVQFRSKETARFVSRLDADTLWHRLRTGKCDPSTAMEDLIASSEADPEDPDAFDVTYRMGRGLFEHQTITYLEEVPGRHLRYHYQSAMTGPRRALAEGIWDATIEEIEPGRTRVTVMSEHIAREPSTALLCWFDDEHRDRLRYFGNKADQRRDWTITGKFRREITAYS